MTRIVTRRLLLRRSPNGLWNWIMYEGDRRIGQSTLGYATRAYATENAAWAGHAWDHVLVIR